MNPCINAIMLTRVLLNLCIITGLALTPPMGWNSWNVYVCDNLTESKIRNTAQLLNDTGLAAAGYRYVNIDGRYDHIE